jgi:hypothetical protein
MDPKLIMISDEGKGTEMPKSKHTEAAIVAALQQLDADGKWLTCRAQRALTRRRFIRESNVRRYGREPGAGG